ncbi:ornithine carbamoyltransferase [Stratiformator vulcanicus]|uniref:Ornithine carbamoyltransferase n=1 Tax=Stratiformator vulcanicus TaxID=2527980 RepID=A0A517R1A3_9PLAN|nr:ornithine carbamoyltransferase [Stratiformator vulcanicus]QDT37646.1 Ornithine carbamoyltransferase [Stratiformator vulcanicus]
MKHLLTLFDWSPDEITETIALADDLKKQCGNGIRPQMLTGQVLAQVYDKPSLRTRVSFETAMLQLGGGATFLTSKEAGWTGRESLPDVAKVLSSFVDAIVIRTFSQQLVEDVAKHAACPVINGLTDDYHPAQALTDVMTIKESTGTLKGVHLAFVGDGNNVAKSLAIICGKLGMKFTLCAPAEHQFDDAFLKKLGSELPDAKLDVTNNVKAAVKSADVIYTDVWASMGQEGEADDRKQVLAPFQVNGDVMKAAPSECLFLHCLPAHRGEEVTDDVIDGPQSKAFEQAENRMHLAKGLLARLLG